MSLRLICGRAGTGKSNFCFEEMKEKKNQQEKIYMITPEQYSFTAEKKLLEKLEVGSSLQVEVLTFARMAYRLLTEVGGIAKPTLSKAGRAMVFYDILEKNKKNLTFLGKSKQNVELLETQITELKKHAISLEKIQKTTKEIESRYLQEKLKDICLIYEEYEKRLQGKYGEENDRLQILVMQLQQTDLFQNAIFYIDEFSGFTKQEYNVIEQLLKIAKQVNVTITTDNLDSSLPMEEDLFYSSKQVADKLLYLARKNQIACEKTVFQKESYRFAKEELKHLEQNLQAMPYQTYPKQVENISLFLAQNPYSEVEEVAKQITKLVKYEKYRYQDIVVMTKEMEPYASLCKAIFQSYDIPVFLDEKKELSQNEFAKYVLALLEIYATNWSYEAVMQYSKTDFSPILPEDIYAFENYTKKWGIKGSKWYQKEWNFGKQTEETKQEQQRMLQIRDNLIFPLYELKQKLTGRKKVSQINQEIYAFLEKQNLQEKLEKKQKDLEEQGKIELAKVQELAWNSIMQVLEEMDILFGKETISFEKYRELLKIGLGQVGLGKIPQTQDQVIIGSFARTKNTSVKALFFLGMNDGVFPSIQKQEGFFNDEDRKKLKKKGMELAKGTLENLYEENFTIYKTLTTAQEKLFFSYPSSNLEGQALRPSTYITKLKKIFVHLQEKSDLQTTEICFLKEQNTFEQLISMLRKEKEQEEIPAIWHAVEKYFEQKEGWKEKLQQAKQALTYQNEPERIQKENMQKLYGNTLVTSVSQLEQYQSCPFSYYLKYSLALKPPEEYKVKPVDTGSFMHEVIDAFFSEVRQRNFNIKQLEEEQVETLVEKIMEEKLGLDQYYIFTSSPKFYVLTNKLKKVVLESMKYLIEGLKNSDFEVFANEFEFKRGKAYKPITLSLEDGKKVEMTGKIDRIDIAKTKDGKYLRIIDYKSSVKNIDLNKVVAGLQIQLLTYLDAACKIEQVLPAGILYYNLIDPILKAEKPIDKEQMEQEIKKQFKMNGFILADINVVKMMDKSLTKGASTVVPVYLDKEGEISKSKSNTITKEQFEDLRNYTNRLIKQIAKEMLSGNIKIQPYYEQKNKKTPCDYCEYKAICHFQEEKCRTYSYIRNDKKEEILEKIKERKEDAGLIE